MWHWRFALNPGSAALEARAAHAGLALACRYSSADEYEADVIQARRDAGLYRSRWRQRYAAAAFGVIAASAVLVFFAG
jgi:hypothetical protein